MPVLFYRFPREKTAMRVLAAQNSMTFFNRRRERVLLLSSIFIGQILSKIVLRKKQQKYKTRVWVDY